MPIDRAELAAKAETAAILIIEGLLEVDLIEELCEAYQQACNDTLRRLDLESRKLTKKDLTRLFLECVCYAAYVAIDQEVAKCLNRRRLLVRKEPDREAIGYFATVFLNSLDMHIDEPKFGTVREIVVTATTPEVLFSEGDPIEVRERVASYTAAGESENAVRLFAQRIALALDPENYPIAQVVGLAFAEPTGRLVRAVLKQVFAE